MNEKVEKFRRILVERQELKKEIAKQLRVNRNIQRRLHSLIKTAEKKKYTYRLELVVVDAWVKQLVDKLTTTQKENNKMIRVGEGLIDMVRLSHLREVVERNPHIDY